MNDNIFFSAFFGFVESAVGSPGYRVFFDDGKFFFATNGNVMNGFEITKSNLAEFFANFRTNSDFAANDVFEFGFRS